MPTSGRNHSTHSVRGFSSYRRCTPFGYFCSLCSRNISKGLAKPSHGFSLIELLACIAIIVLITGVVLARYKSFNSTVLLRNLAYEIALSVREAQVFGISVRGAGGSFTTVYGMHFAPGTTYTLFADHDSSGGYTVGEDVSSYAIGQQNSINALCVDAACGLATLDVLFKRPDPDAKFYRCTSPNPASCSAVSATSASVVVGAVGGGANTRAVRVLSTGQIAVE